MGFEVPLQLVGPELAGVQFRRRVGDILQQGVGEGQPGQDTLRPVNEWSIKDLQDEGQDAELIPLKILTVQCISGSQELLP